MNQLHPSPPAAPSESFSRARRIELIALFGLLTVFTPIAIDMYLPALPTIAREFGTPIAAIEHSLATYFLGIAIGQAAIGPISDRYGRRWPIIAGLALYVLGANGCALAQGPLTLDAARFVQALGGCAGTVLARACVRDLFPPHEAGRIFAQMLLILSVSPLFAPFVGGWLLPLTGWRSLFWLQSATALLTLALVWLQLPESHPGSDRRLHPLHVARDYWVIAADRHFYGYIVPAILSGAGLYVFLTGWPHVVIDMYRVAPQYFGFTFIMNGVGLIVFSQATARWLRRHPGEPLLFAGIVANAAIGSLALLFAVTGWGGILGLIPWMFLYCSLMGSINPTSAGLTMHHFGHAAGMASALIGIFLYGGGAIASLAMGALEARTPVPMTALMCGFGLSGLVTYLLFRPPASR
ncbi:MAG TPA: multidrug effflux MFS transporter [Rhizomicrobium sp.]|nr:multidrug effflux MFS transporter [Rhizomicrobium sp.]